MRDYKKENDRDAEKYKRLTFKADREKYDKLTVEQQETLKGRVRRYIENFLKRPR